MIPNYPNQADIYHYTSNSVLKSILQKKKIWATRSITSNDNEDTHYIIKILNNLKKEHQLNWLLEEIFDLVTTTLKNAKNFSSNTIKDRLYNLSKNTIEGHKQNDTDLFTSIANSFMMNETSQAYPFVLCFSQNPDSRFFWDTYTKNTGVNIGFKKDELVEYFLKRYKKLDNVVLRTGYVIYNENDQKERIRSLVNDTSSIFLSKYEKYDIENLLEEFSNKLKHKLSNPNKEEIITLLIVHQIVFELLREAPFIKHPYWKEEEEFRIVFYEKYIFKYNFDIKENYKKKYDSNSRTQDYIEVDIPIDKIRRITVGPNNEEDSILQQNSYNIQLSNSNGKDVVKNIKY